MVAVEKEMDREDGYWLSVNEYNDIRIAMARVSSIGNFISNAWHLIDDNEGLLAQIGEQLVKDADATDEIMNTSEVRLLDERHGRSDNREMENTRKSVWLLIKRMDERGFRGKEIVTDILSESMKPIAEYKGNGEKAQEG